MRLETLTIVEAERYIEGSLQHSLYFHLFEHFYN